MAKSDLSNDLKKACSATKSPMRTYHEEPLVKRFNSHVPAFITTSPVVLVFTFLSLSGYWRQVPVIPDVPEAVKTYVNVQQTSQGFALPPPALPRSTPLHVKGPVDLACRAVKSKHGFGNETS